MELLIIYFVFCGFISAGIFGRHLGKDGTGYIVVGSVFLALCCAINSFVEIGLRGTKVLVELGNWVMCGNFNLDFGFWIDSVTVVMLVVVLFISLLVHIYSLEYMASDPHKIRFLCYLSLFTFFMLMLLLADNLVQMFWGWEGVGLSSYLLINFWFTRLEANKSALKAIIVNRVGDFGIGFALVLTYWLLKSVKFGVIFSMSHVLQNYSVIFLGLNLNVITLVGIFLVLGAIGKSAQLGLHVWLPDAMEGPTPVSALIHAATMVTAGVYVIIRFSPWIDYSQTLKIFVAMVGGVTAYFAGTVGLCQNDIKKIIAYSTCSQLGYMVFACGLSNYPIALFHLFNHAFFKALLFLCAGGIIHSFNEEQDIRRMGGLLKLLPFTYVAMLIGSFSLMGLPYLTGFYSKDLILEISLEGSSILVVRFLYGLLTLATMCTALYSMRLIHLVFYLEPRGTKRVYEHVNEVGVPIRFCLFMLALCSMFVGYFFKEMFVGLGSTFFNNAIFIHSEVMMVNALGDEFISPYYKLLPVLFSFLAGFVGVALYDPDFYDLRFKATRGGLRHIYIYLNQKWLFDFLYNKYFNRAMLSFGYHITFKLLDRGLIEYIGPTGIVRFIRGFISRLTQVQSGYIYHYVYLILMGVVIYLSMILFGFDRDVEWILNGVCVLYIYIYIVGKSIRC